MPGRKHMRHSAEYWELGLAKPGEMQCTSKLKSKPGERCPRAALPGASVCKIHGGAAPQVLAAAAVRIGMSLEDAVKRLQAMLNDLAVEPREKVKILHDFLDRGGLAATSKHLVGVGTVDAVDQLMMDLLQTPGMFAASPTVPPALEDAHAAQDAAAHPARSGSTAVVRL